MLYALLLLIFFTVLTLAVRSGVVKRVFLLAILFMVMLVCGVIWNMVPAYLISLCLPLKRAVGDLKKPI